MATEHPLQRYVRPLHTAAMILGLLLLPVICWMEYERSYYPPFLFPIAIVVGLIIASYCVVELRARRISHRNLLSTSRSLTLLFSLLITLLASLYHDLGPRKYIASTRMLEELRALDAAAEAKATHR